MKTVPKERRVIGRSALVTLAKSWECVEASQLKEEEIRKPTRRLLAVIQLVVTRKR